MPLSNHYPPMPSLDPDRPEIARLLEGAAALSIVDCETVVRRCLRAQHRTADAATAAMEIIRGPRDGPAADRARRLDTARRALDRVPGLLRHIPEELREGEYILPLRAIAEQAVLQAMEALLAGEALPLRHRRALLAPFEGLIDGLTTPPSASAPR